MMEILTAVKGWFGSIFTAIKSKAWMSLVFMLIPVILTILVIWFFKIPVFKPIRKRYTRYRQRRTARRSRRRTRRTRRR